VSATRLWGWLSPDNPDPLAAAPLAERMLVEALGLSRLLPTPPEPLDERTLPASRLTPNQSAAIAAALAGRPPARDAASRAAAALGQSYPDQLQRRAGRCASPVDGVACPNSHAQLQALIDAAVATGFRVMVVGGATSVVGGLSVAAERRPLVAADLSGLGEIVSFSGEDRTVAAQAGIRVADLERRLSDKGMTLGHFPQSFEAATLGGSIAANGAGQRSDGYGRITDRLLRLRLATPSGEWLTEPVRHSAAGPWLGGLVAGSEGLLGAITEATMAVSPKPEWTFDAGWLFPSFAAAMQAARAAAQTGIGHSMLRISDEVETAFLSRFRQARAGLRRPPWAERIVLALKRAPANPSLLIAGYEGSARFGADAVRALRGLFRRHGGVALGERPGQSWRRSRYEAPHLRESLMARGLGVDTFETAAPWSRLAGVYTAVGAALSRAIGESSGGSPGIVMCHLSHSYPDAACLYFTAVFPRAGDALAQWRAIKRAACEAMVAAGSTISHHHGLGADHAPYAQREKGDASLRLLRALAREIDPKRVMATGASSLL
jgi:alkyldihydroxyacetonephosphate synthase